MIKNIVKIPKGDKVSVMGSRFTLAEDALLEIDPSSKFTQKEMDEILAESRRFHLKDNDRKFYAPGSDPQEIAKKMESRST